jgi:hypothetical protein
MINLKPYWAQAQERSRNDSMEQRIDPRLISDQGDTVVTQFVGFRVSDHSCAREQRANPAEVGDFISILKADHWTPFFARLITPSLGWKMVPRTAAANVADGSLGYTIALSQYRPRFSAVSDCQNVLRRYLCLVIVFAGKSMRPSHLHHYTVSVAS